MTLDLSPGEYLQTAQEKVVFGRPAAEVVVDEAVRTGARRVFVTSSRSLAGLADGPLQKIERALGDRHAGTHTTIRAHTPREDVIAAANAARAAGADLLVAVGGGSVIDATKAMLMCLWCGIDDPAAMEAYRREPGRDALPIVASADPLRMLSVSTTLSAADFTPGCGVTESSTHSKQSFSHRLFVPRVAILDPAGTFDTPIDLLMATGMRSVDHAVESFCSSNANLATRFHSVQGLRLLPRALAAIRQDPTALEPRLQAQLGMWQAILGSVAGAGTGASHGIGYALGATFGVAHGHTSCVLLPAVLRWNESANGELQRQMAAEMGNPQESSANLLFKLVASLGQPATLQALSLKHENLAEIARRALAYAPVRNNPRPIRGADDVMEILELAWHGGPW